MNATAARIVALLIAYAIGCGLSGWIGWEWRDRSADLATQTDETAQQGARADALQGARDQDHGNAQAAAQVESQRINEAGKTAAHFDKLEQDIDTHAQAADLRRDRGNADPDFVRIWREANAGRHANP